MRGMVMEVYDNTLIILTNDGDFLEIEKSVNEVSIGDQIPYNILNITNKPKNIVGRYGLWVASLIVACVVSLTSYGYTQPFGYVNLDINPSAVISYNWFEKVIEIKALNEDGKNIINVLDSVKNQELNLVVNKFIAVSNQQGYIYEEGLNIIFISVSDRSSQDRSLKILKEIDEIVIIPPKTDKVLVIGNSISYSKVKEHNLSPTKEIIDESIETGNFEMIIFKSSKPIKELMKEAKEVKKDIKETEKDIKEEEKDKKNKPKKNEENINNTNSNTNSNKNNDELSDESNELGDKKNSETDNQTDNQTDNNHSDDKKNEIPKNTDESNKKDNKDHFDNRQNNK